MEGDKILSCTCTKTTPHITPFSSWNHHISNYEPIEIYFESNHNKKKRKTTLNKWSETKPLGFLRQYIHLHSVCVQNSILAKLKVLIYSFYFSFKNPKSPFTKLLIIKESYLFFESSFLCAVGFIVYFNAIYSNTIDQPAYSLGFEQWPAENLRATEPISTKLGTKHS